MNQLAEWLARRLWWGAMWLMRRPRLKAIQRFGLEHLVRPSRRAAAQESLNRQNRFARRHAVTMLRVSVLIFLASVALTVVFQATLALVDAGILTPPDSALGR